MSLTRHPLQEKIEAEMIQRAITNDGIATLTLSTGEKTVFQYGTYISDLPKKLKKHDPVFYYKLRDEIFDELHPY